MFLHEQKPGFVIFTNRAKKASHRRSSGVLNSRTLSFSRQMFAAFDEIVNLPQSDRIGPIIGMLKSRNVHANEVVRGNG